MVGIIFHWDLKLYDFHDIDDQFINRKTTVILYMIVTNNHFKELVHQWANFLKNSSELPKDLIDTFLREVKVSNLLLPIKQNDSDNNFDHIITKDGLKFIPLFTDEDELLRYDDECISVPNEIDFYISLVDEVGYDGIVINPESDALYIDSYMLNRIEPYEEKASDKQFTGSELKKVAFEAANPELLEFISDKNNFNNYDGLIDLFVNSTLLNVVLTYDDLSGYAHDGVIAKRDVLGFGLTKSRRGDEDYVVLFTGLDPIIRSLDKSQNYHYIQVVNLFEMIKFLLVYDMDGIILNPALEDYFIPRHVLVDIMEKKLVDEPKYPNSFDYAFEF